MTLSSRLLSPRRVRTLRRLAVDATTPTLYPSAPMIRTFWWSDEPNFGDDLTPFLLRRAGIAPLLKPAASCELAAVGSILELLPADYDGFVWGSGKMHQDEPTPLTNAKVFAVRGRLTAERIDPPVETLGDPGLLVSDHVQRGAPNAELGVIPHFTHAEHPDLLALAAEARGARLIDVRASAGAVAAEISRCAMVVSTSLHGLIVADAFGVPAAWGLAEPVLAGADFKFRDYESVINPGNVDRRLPIDASLSAERVAAAAWSPDADLVEGVRAGLRGALAGIRDRPDWPRVSPLALAVRQFRG